MSVCTCICIYMDVHIYSQTSLGDVPGACATHRREINNSLVQYRCILPENKMSTKRNGKVTITTFHLTRYIHSSSIGRNSFKSTNAITACALWWAYHIITHETEYKMHNNKTMVQLFTCNKVTHLYLFLHDSVKPLSVIQWIPLNVATTM